MTAPDPDPLYVDVYDPAYEQGYWDGFDSRNGKFAGVTLLLLGGLSGFIVGIVVGLIVANVR